MARQSQRSFGGAKRSQSPAVRKQNMEDIARKIISFMDVVEKLCHVKRHILMQDGRDETDSDHIMKLAFLVMLISPYLKQPHNTQKMLEMALVHDLAEADTGDIPIFISANNPKIKAEKALQEREAIEKYRSMLPLEIGNKIYNLFIEYEENKTFEARFVKALDKFEGNIQANKNNYGAEFYAKGWTPVLDKIREHKFSAELNNEEIISAIERALVENAESNIEHCKKKGLI
jgi:putative hydrolase of HD superfamily